MKRKISLLNLAILLPLGLCAAVLLLGHVAPDALDGLILMTRKPPEEMKPLIKWPLPIWTNSIGMEFKLVPEGDFEMGTTFQHPPEQNDRPPEQNNHPPEQNNRPDRPHWVRINQSFYLGTYEVTQEEWVAVMGNNPSHHTSGKPGRPVENVSWNDVQEFIRRLNEKEKTNAYRLPTEAEWEYGARARTKTHYSFGRGGFDTYEVDLPRLQDFACYRRMSELFRIFDYPVHWRQSIEHPHPVGSFRPNDWGLHDMQGNVEEWVQDWFDYYPRGPMFNPQGPKDEKDGRVIRGGSCASPAREVGVSIRSSDAPENRHAYRGFRLARALTPDAPFSPPRSQIP